MGLFGNKSAKPDTVKRCEVMLKQFFVQCGLNEKEQRWGDDGDTWQIIKGSALIFIYIKEDKTTDGQDASFIRVACITNLLPQENLLPLYRKLLELNNSLLGIYFTIFENKIMLLNERPLEGLDPEELSTNISWLAHVADEYDNVLEDEFGAKLFTDNMGS